jgi:hypothetical protein
MALLTLSFAEPRTFAEAFNPLYKCPLEGRVPNLHSGLGIISSSTI